MTTDNVPPPAQARENYIEVRNLTVRFGSLVAVDDVSFGVRAGEHLSLLGPSGCGKTTTLRCIAGLETPTTGEIVVGGRTLYSSDKGINVPIEKRDLSMMFQSYAIWPHMTVSENIAYSLKIRKVPKDRIRKRVLELLGMIGMEEYADTGATKLSGGQQQRVALARSYAHPPHALLLDEPLSNLDARLREQMRDDLVAFQKEAGMTTVYVTHDQEEAMSLSSRIVVMRKGKIVQVGSPAEIYNTPRTEFVANFIGAANIVGGRLVQHDGRWILLVGDAEIHCGIVPEALGADSEREHRAAIRTVYPLVRAPGSSAGQVDHGNVWPARVASKVFLGDTVVLHLEWPGHTALRVLTTPGSGWSVGDDVELVIDPARVVILEPEVD